MNHDEFAFFNRQLAAMTREGIPLEGALRQLSHGMRAGTLKKEVELLEKDLASGTPLVKAIENRAFPELYRRMIRVGVTGNDLAGVLTMVADHYDRSNALWTRLKGLMVYPVLVVIISLGLTTIISVVLGRFLRDFMSQPMLSNAPEILKGPWLLLSVWAPPLVLGVVVMVGIALASSTKGRGWLRWSLPGFREASIAQLASSLALMLRKGTPLPEALALAEGLERGTPAEPELSRWRTQTEQGQGSPAKWESRRPIPPLFLWLVQQAGTDVGGGFDKASELYHRRASYRIEMMLYGALPISILLLAQMILWQAAPLVQTLLWFMNLLGDLG